MNLTKLFIWMDNLRGYATKNLSTLTGLMKTNIKHVPGRGMITKSPIVARISGVLALNSTVEDYHKHLDDKFLF